MQGLYRSASAGHKRSCASKQTAAWLHVLPLLTADHINSQHSPPTPLPRVTTTLFPPSSSIPYHIPHVHLRAPLQQYFHRPEGSTFCRRVQWGRANLHTWEGPGSCVLQALGCAGRPPHARPTHLPWCSHGSSRRCQHRFCLSTCRLHVPGRPPSRRRPPRGPAAAPPPHRSPCRQPGTKVSSHPAQRAEGKRLAGEYKVHT